MRPLALASFVSLALFAIATTAQAATPLHARLDLSLPLSCYQSMQMLWNRTQTPPSSSIKLTQVEYEGFAVCATLAVKDHDDDSYFADTIGAMYAQSWLRVLYKRAHKNASAHQHFALARDLNTLARSLAAAHDPMGTTSTALSGVDQKYKGLDSGKIPVYDPK